MGLALAAVVGCAEGTSPGGTTSGSGSASAPGSATTPAVPAAPAADAPPIAEAKTPLAGAATLSDDEIAQIEKLPEAERGAALAQKVCPVSGENLGSMGAPIKEVVGGRTVFICCKGCEKELQDDPDTFLAKLKR
ncbi:MAG TPA: hypothetical protein VF590_11905 [Isosphaeraceae bacterium]